jgi:hypothetical protein
MIEPTLKRPRGTGLVRLIGLAEAHPILSAVVIRAAGIHPQVVARALAAGHIERAGPRHYRHAGSAPIERHAELADLCHANPQVVTCLLSAAQVHSLTTRLESAPYLAIPAETTLKASVLPAGTRVFRWRPSSIATAVETAVTASGRPIRLTSEAKTIVDLARYQDDDGLSRGGRPAGVAGSPTGITSDVVIEALDTYLRRGGDFDAVLGLAGSYPNARRNLVAYYRGLSARPAVESEVSLDGLDALMGEIADSPGW